MDIKKLMFWKKDDLGLGLDNPLPEAKTGLDPNIGLGTQPGQQPSYPSFQPSPGGFGPQPQAFQSMQQDQRSPLSKDIEIISSKLDAIKSAVDNLNQRLANLERMVYSEGQNSSSHGYKEMPSRPY